jgi:hypothetical protein
MMSHDEGCDVINLPHLSSDMAHHIIYVCAGGGAAVVDQPGEYP